MSDTTEPGRAKEEFRFGQVVAISGAAALGIAGCFGLIVWLYPSSNLQGSGTFGDSFGALNACAALFGVLLLVWTLKLQAREFSLMRDEYEKTKAELARSAKAQEELIAETNKSMQLGACSALLNSVHEEIRMIETDIADIKGAIRDMDAVLSRAYSLEGGIPIPFYHSGTESAEELREKRKKAESSGDAKAHWRSRLVKRIRRIRKQIAHLRE